MIHKIITTLIATLLITSIVGPVAGLAAAQGGGQGPPDGMVGVPSSNVGPPDHARGGGHGSAQGGGGPPDHVELPDAVPTHAAAWSIHADRHADALEVTIGEIDGELALVFADDENHAGREISVDAATLTDAVGHRPDLAYVAHESGDQYAVPIEYERGSAILSIEEFSSNTVTFSGGIVLEGDAATPGTTYEYDLTDMSSVSNFSIGLEGREATSSEAATSTLADGESLPFDVGGNAAPRDETVTLTGVGTEESRSTEATLVDGESRTVSSAANAGVQDGTVTVESAGTAYHHADWADSGTHTMPFPDEIKYLDELRLYYSYYPNEIARVTVHWENGSSSHITRYDSDPGGTSKLYDVGWDVTNAESIEFAQSYSGSDTVDAAKFYGGHPQDVEITQDGSTTSLGDFDGSTSQEIPLELAAGESTTITGTHHGGEGLAINASWTDVNASENPAATVNGETVSYSGLLGDGETHSESVSLDRGSHSAAVSAGGGDVGVSVEWTEVTEAVDPGISVNGHVERSYGTLGPGETVTLPADESWLQEGNNTVEILASEPSSGPSPEVGFTYQHEAAGTAVESSVESTTWREHVETSHTFPSDQTGATATIAFSERAVAIDDVEINRGGSWESVAESDRSWDSDRSALDVELGDVAAGETIALRATAEKVRVRDGSITVTDPTTAGEPLDTRIRLDELGDGFRIEVNESAHAGELHYTHSESWSDVSTFARFGAGGRQALHFPEATASDQLRVSTVDLGVNPTTGSADVRVLEDSDEPEIEIVETDSERIEIEWRETTSGHRYQLYSLDAELERDTATASSPVTLMSPGVAERLKVYDLGSASGGGDNSGVVGPTASRSFGANAAFIIGAAVAGLLVLFGATRRWGDGAISSGALFGTGAVVIVLVVLQLLAPNVLADYIGRAFESAFPLVLLAGAAITIIWLRQRGDDTSIIIQGGQK